MEQLRRDVYAGATLEIELTPSSNPMSGRAQDAEPRLRFKDEDERAAHRMGMARRQFVRRFNATFRAGDLYITPTLDDEHEVHTFAEARRIRSAFRRRVKRAYPDAVMVIVMGRGKSTARIHYHAVVHGVPYEGLERLWTWGKIQAPRTLRLHNYYEMEDGSKVDIGEDYRGLATYLFGHWTPEQGGHYYMATRNLKQPERERRTEARRRYSPKRPPRPPKGYTYIMCEATTYGYMCFRYVRLID